MADQSNGHEYRFAYAILAVAGSINGIIDALSDDFTAKFFISKIVDLLMFLWVTYEMLIMDKPKRPFLASMLLLSLGFSGYVGFWHLSWMITWTLFRGQLPNPLWLAPNVYINLNIYNAIAFMLAVAYTLYGILINASDRVKSIYSPSR